MFDFCLDSMKKYNGCNVMRKFDGTMEIYSKDRNEVVWNGTIADTRSRREIDTQ